MMRMIDGEEPRFKDLDNRFMADCEESSQRYFFVSLLTKIFLYKSSCFFFLLDLESRNDPDTNKMLNEKKQSMVCSYLYFYLALDIL